MSINFVFIIYSRSGKHSSSNAVTHGEDFQHLYNVPEFDVIMKCETSGQFVPKPVVIIIPDGGPDENPRYQRVIEIAINHFLKFDLDAIFIATNAPHRSAYNRVERRMAPLSHALCGLVLPHDFYGTHLNDKNETTDSELEIRNFAKAGETLAEIWSETVIDNYPTVARFVGENSTEGTITLKDASWYNIHVSFGQYITQITKCSDTSCCKASRSSIFGILKDGRIPPPVPLDNSTSLSVSKTECSALKVKDFATLLLNIIFSSSVFGSQEKCFDKFCPSVQSKLPKRICKSCGKYFSCLKYLQSHVKIHNKNPSSHNKQLQTASDDVIKPRPKRIAAIRATEILAIMSYDLNMEDAEWWEKEDLDLDQNDMDEAESRNQKAESNKTVSIANAITSPWVESSD